MIVEGIEKASAKVNLALWAGGRRDDGFHDVTTVLHMLDLHDTLHLKAVKSRKTVTPSGRSATDASPLHIEISSDSSDAPTGKDNLVWPAIRSIEKEILAAGYGQVSVHIEKRIPIAAGLAGGSADAAAAMRGFTRLLSLPISEGDLSVRAARLGTDVPASLMGGTLMGVGRGEQVEPLAAGRFWWVLANPGGHLSAGEVYDALADDRHRRGWPAVPPPHTIPDAFRRALASSDPRALADFLHNDLAQPACNLHAGAADLLKMMQAMEKQGLLASTVSGSGPTIVGLAENGEAAQRCAAALHKRVPWVWWGESEVSHVTASSDRIK